MHELAIVEALVKQCEEQVRLNNAQRVLSVEVKIGILSGVEPHFLETTFHTFKQDTVCECAELVMNMQKIVVVCKRCGCTNTLEKHHFICPTCKSDDLEVVDGEELMLMRLEME